MKESYLRNTERFLKSHLKRKVSITIATAISFILTGGVTLSEDITEALYYYDGQKHILNENITISDPGQVNGDSAALNVGGDETFITIEGDITVKYGSDSYEADLHPRGVQLTNNSKTVNNGTTTTIGDHSEAINVVGGAEFTNGKDGKVITAGYNSEGILGSDSAIINNDGTIATSGDTGVGIIVWNNSLAINNGTIETEGNRSAGMFALANNGSYGNSYLENNGTIKTKGEESFGMNASDTSKAVNNGKIITEGKYGYGMLAQQNSSVTNNGNIITDGEKSHGIYITEDSTALNSKGGSITTKGERASGVRGWDNTSLINNGEINTEGYKARGIHGGRYSTIENNGKIETKGDSAQGIITFFGSTGKNTSGGTITTRGDNAQGIFIETNLYDYDTIYNEEKGEYQAVLLKCENESSFINNGSISTTGEGAYGVLLATTKTWDGFHEEVAKYEESKEWTYDHSLDKGSSFENSGTITTSGDRTYGIYAFTEEGMPHSEVYNYKGGEIKTTGDSAVGVYLENSKFLNEGIIETFGDKAYGIYADNSSINNSGIIRTHGDGSYGVYAVNSSSITHSGEIYVDDSNAYGIVYDETSTVTVSKDAVIEVGGDRSSGIQVISNIEPVLITNSSSEAAKIEESSSSTRRAVDSTDPFLGDNDMVLYTNSFEVKERATLYNQGTISATGEGANAIVLSNADLINNGSISSDTGYAIVSIDGDNTVTLTEGSNVDGIIKGGSGNDTLFLEGSNKDDFSVIGYNKVVKTGGGTWILENSTIQLEASKDTSNVSSYSEAIAIDENVSGNIVIGNSSTVVIKVNEEGNSGQMIAEVVVIEGDVNLDIDSSNNDGKKELKFENMIVTKDGVTLGENGSIDILSDGWDTNYTVNEDGTVDVGLSMIAYTDRAHSNWMELAGILETNYKNVNGDMRSIMNELNDLNNVEYNNALEQISGNLYTSTIFINNEVSKQFERNIREFMRQDKGGIKEASARKNSEDNKQYLTFIGSTSSYDGDNSTTGFDTDSFGFIGANELLDNLGLSYGYINSSVDYNDKSKSSSDIETFHGGLFHKYGNNGLKVNTNLGFDYSKNDVNRKISFGDINRKASSDFDSYAISLGTEVGYDFYVEALIVTPRLGFTYSRIEQGSISESEADALNIKIDSESYDSIRTTLGLDVATSLEASYGTYKFSLMGEWNHEFGDIYDDQYAKLEGTEGSFKIRGLNVSQDTLRLGTKLDLNVKSGTTYFVGYTYEMESSYDNHMGTLGIKLTF